VKPFIGAVKAAEIHRRDISRVIDPVLERGCRVEAGRIFEDLRAVLRWAHRRGDLERNPMEGMEKPAGGSPRYRVLTDAEITKLWDGLATTLVKSPSCQRIIKLLLVTLQRPGEVSGMALAELDLDHERVWSIPGSRTKNKRTHRVPLTDAAIAIIREALEAAGKDAKFIFPNEAGTAGFSSRVVAKTIAAAQDRFGLAHWTAHDLRRTGLTNLAQLGVAPIVAGAVANHVSVTKAGVTLGVYVQYSYEKEKRAALALWSKRLAAIVQQKRSITEGVHEAAA
jgi:integrase